MYDLAAATGRRRVGQPRESPRQRVERSGAGTLEVPKMQGKPTSRRGFGPAERPDRISGHGAKLITRGGDAIDTTILVDSGCDGGSGMKIPRRKTRRVCAVRGPHR